VAAMSGGCAGPRGSTARAGVRGRTTQPSQQHRPPVVGGDEPAPVDGRVDAEEDHATASVSIPILSVLVWQAARPSGWIPGRPRRCVPATRTRATSYVSSPAMPRSAIVARRLRALGGPPSPPPPPRGRPRGGTTKPNAPAASARTLRTVRRPAPAPSLGLRRGVTPLAPSLAALTTSVSLSRSVVLAVRARARSVTCSRPSRPGLDPPARRDAITATTGSSASTPRRFPRARRPPRSAL